MALRLHAMVKLFTPSYAAPSSQEPSGSLDNVNEKPGCLTIDRGQLVSIGQARSYMGKKDDEDEKPVPKEEDIDGIFAEKKKSRKKPDKESMESQEELKRKREPKPDATE